MAHDWKKNTVHRVVYHQARGINPLLPFEIFMASMTGLGGALCLELLLGICIALATASGLFAWRMAEHDRREYALVLARRVQRGRRCYNSLGSDRAAAYLPPYHSPRRGA